MTSGVANRFKGIKVWLDETYGYWCIIAKIDSCRLTGDPYHFCGYVGVPKSHPWHGKDYGIGNINDPIDLIYVHGGLTFANRFGPPITSDDWFFGFDCAHSGDSLKTCTEDYVKKQVGMLAKQLKYFEDKDIK